MAPSGRGACGTTAVGWGGRRPSSQRRPLCRQTSALQVSRYDGCRRQQMGGGGQGVAGEGEGAVNVNKKAGGVDGHRFSQD